MIELAALSFRHGPAPLIEGLDLRLEGRASVLLGPSGCGKSTLLALLAGLLRPSAGRIAFDGTPWSDGRRAAVPPARRRIGMVFQDLALWPHLDALAHVAFAAEGGRAERRRRAHDVIARVGLGARARARPDELSGGERQRLALARALARSPRLLLLDEPFAHLDAHGRRELRADLAALQAADGFALLAVTHALDDALALADELCLLERPDGGTLRAVAQGPPERLLREPGSGLAARRLELGAVLEGSVEDGMLRCALGSWPAPDGAANGRWELLVRPSQARLAGDGLAARVISCELAGERCFRVRAAAEGVTLELDADVRIAPGAAVSIALERPHLLSLQA